MIKWIFISFFAAVLIGICVFDEILVQKTFRIMISKTTEVVAELDENGITGTSKDLIENLETYWHKKQKPMSVFIHHEETKFLGDRLTLAKAYIENDMKDEAVIELGALIYEAATLKKLYKFTITNIF